MPSVWFWIALAELLSSGRGLLPDASAYCSLHVGPDVASVLLFLFGTHVLVGCLR